MKSDNLQQAIADVTATQWGMITTAQAAALGVGRLKLARLADAGHLERLAHGVYRDTGAPSDQFEDLRAAWLSTQPKLRADERIRDAVGDVVVASSSAGMLHGIGDQWASRHEFVVPTRRQTQRTEIRYRQRMLESRDVTIVGGLPVMSLERTLADLLEDIGDMSLVADALSAAMKKRELDLDRMRQLLAPLAARNGLGRHEGGEVLDRLMEIAGLDIDSVARRIVAHPVLSSKILELSSKILEDYFKSMMPSLEIPGMETFTKQFDQFVSANWGSLIEKMRPVTNPSTPMDFGGLMPMQSVDLLKGGRGLLERADAPTTTNLPDQSGGELTVSQSYFETKGETEATREVEE